MEVEEVGPQVVGPVYDMKPFVVLVEGVAGDEMTFEVFRCDQDDLDSIRIV